MNTDFWFWVFCAVCKVDSPTTFREPLWVPKRRRGIYLTNLENPQTKNQYQLYTSLYGVIFHNTKPSSTERAARIEYGAELIDLGRH
jgi:hypothetical protein